jgi:competence protein ComFC
LKRPYNYNQLLKPAAMEINPQKLDGHWNEGWALDLHTTSSTLVGVDEHGHNRFQTVRPPIAEELFKLKYRSDRHRIATIAKPAAEFLNKFKAKWEIDLIIPIPPSDTNRPFQPVYELARAISGKVNLPVDFTTLKKNKSTSQLKEVNDADERKKILNGAFDTALSSLNGKDVLIFDDLYRSGETLNAVCDILIKKGKARGVYVLTITKTRSKR